MSTLEMNPEAKPVHLALLGAGKFAKSAHFSVLSPLQKAGRIKVELVWSRRRESATSLAEQYGDHVTAAYFAGSTPVHDKNDVSDVDGASGFKYGAKVDEAVLASAHEALKAHRERITAVVLCVPIPQNAAFSSLVLDLGLHVLCEKPISHDIPSALKLLEHQSSTPSIHHAIAENFRFERAFQIARSRISTVCQQVIAFRLTAQTPMPAGSPYAFGWRLKIPGAGMLTDGFVHQVAALRYLASSDVNTVSANCLRKGSHFAGCDTAVVNMQFCNGLVANVFVTLASSVFEWELVIVGVHGDVILRRKKGEAGYYVGERKGVDDEVIEFMPFCGLEAEFGAFITSCQTGVLDDALQARVAFNDMATVHSMFQSSEEQGRPIAVPRAPEPR